jgi:capsular exopolysaccharide synthesis family protein
VSSSLALGVLAGAVVGAALIWLLEFLDTRIRRPERLRDIANAPVLGTITADPQDSPEALVAAGRTTAADGYRTLRTALQFVEVDATAPVFVITGAQIDPGTAAVAVNTAAAMAEAGQRVLLIDADLHTPSLSDLLGRPAGQPGLTEVLAGSAAVGDATQRWTDGNLDLIVAGTPTTSPTEQIQSKAMDALLSKLRGQYDVVILAAPPLDAVTDAALLAAAADGAVLVARDGKTTADQVKRAVQRLDMVRARMLGSVLLGARESGVQLPYPPLGDGSTFDQGLAGAQG